jgi:mono/diheme cytochrome c family protein
LSVSDKEDAVLRSAIRSTICILAAVAIISIMPAPLLAQPQVDPAPAIEAVTQAAFLEGNWAGEGWIQMGPGPKEEFTQTETVTSMLDGAVLLIEGIGHAKGEDSANKVHHAMALISFDPAQNTLVFSSYVAGRPRLDLVPEVAANTFKWGFSPPGGGEIRYSIVVEDGVWHETGEYSRDGESWNQFFEMHLNKLGTSGRSESSPDRVVSPVQAQLERGAAVYRELCYACHELESGDGATLSPDVLASYYDARSLHDYIGLAMPYDEPGSLSVEETWAVAAYLIEDRGLARLDAPLAADVAEGVRLGGGP